MSVLDRTTDLRCFFDENAPSRLKEHDDILNELWPDGDRSVIYTQIIPSIPGRQLYSTLKTVNNNNFLKSE